MIKLILLGILLFPLPVQKINASKLISTFEADNHLFYQGEFVSIHLEKVLYETDNPDYFYIRVEIKNTSDRIIGLDLNDHWKILYPNQWGIHDTTYRMFIDEMMIIPDELDNKKKKDLISSFKNDQLKKLAPDESFVYFTEFNANGRSKIDQEEGGYFILTIDGQLFLTDGNECERIACNRDNKAQRELILKMPLKWERIINEDLIIER